jgi:hypothetical protein
MLGLTIANQVTRNNVARANVVEAAVDPTTIDDSDDGYPNGMRWHNTVGDTVFELLDNTPGAAVWVELTAAGGGGAPTNATYVVMSLNGTLTAERVLAVGSPITLVDGGAGGNATIDFDETVTLGNNARTAVNKNSGATVGTRRRLNFIEGTNVTLTVADDAGNEEVDITIAASGGGTTWTEVEIDFGTTPKRDASFTVTDGTVSATSKVQVLPCAKAATGRTSDDWQWDGIDFAALPATGSFTLYATVNDGNSVVGPRKIQYGVN